MPTTIGSFEEYSKIFPEGPSGRAKAVESYLKNGFIKVQGNRLVYPTTQRVQKQIDEKAQKVSQLNKQINEWNHRERQLDSSKVSDSVKKAFSPLYWEHKMKLLTDKDYREVYELVQPPMHLINQEKWNKRLSIFVKSEEHRLRLKEARLSKIGKKRDKMSKEVERRMEFNRQLASMNKERIIAQKRELESQIALMRELMRWSKESGV